MRQKVIDLLAERDIVVDERQHDATELVDASEVFLTNSQFGVLSLRSCGDATWTDRPFVRQLASWLEEAGIREPAG